MTSDPLRQLATKLDQVEAKAHMNSQMIERIAEYQVQAFQGLGELTRVVEQQGRNLNQLTLRVDQLTQRVDQLGQRVEQVNDRVDSLAAASERYDRILDYLLRRDSGDNLADA